MNVQAESISPNDFRTSPVDTAGDTTECRPFQAPDASSVKLYTRFAKLPLRRCARSLDVRAAGADTRPRHPQFCCQRCYTSMMMMMMMMMTLTMVMKMMIRMTMMTMKTK